MACVRFSMHGLFQALSATFSTWNFPRKTKFLAHLTLNSLHFSDLKNIV